MSNPVSLIIIGAGGRGTGYANLIKALGDRATVTAVAEPRDFQRNRIGDMFNIPEERRFRCWSEVAKLPKFADAVCICTQDAMQNRRSLLRNWVTTCSLKSRWLRQPMPAAGSWLL